MHQKNTSPLARAENPKVQRPSEVSWSYLYLATSSSAITRVEFILPKKKSSSSWARAKKQKKIGALEPLLGRHRQSTSSFALSVLVELRLGCYLLVWHRDGTKCLSCFGWYYRHLHILRRPRRNQLFDVHSLSSWGRRF